MTSDSITEQAARAEALRLYPERWVHGSVSYDENAGKRALFVNGAKFAAGLLTNEAPATEDEAAGWEREDEWEKGQPNGLGVIEPNDTREWFTDELTTHRRRVITHTGPWVEVSRWIPCPCTDQIGREDHTCRYCDDQLGHWIDPTD